MNAATTSHLIVALVLLTSACSGVTTRPDSNPANTPSEEVAMDPMLIKANTDDKGDVQSVEALDSSTLWKDATRAVKRGQHTKAIDTYALLIQHFPDTQYFIPSLYNTGWAYERLEQWDKAMGYYTKVIEEVPGKPSATDAMYRMAECHARLGHWQEVAGTIDAIMGRSNLSLYDRIEAHARLGTARLELGQLSEAEQAYNKAIRLNARAPLELAVPVHSHFIAASQFGLSRVYHELFRKIKLSLPVERMETDLEDKAQLFKQAQSRYLRTIRAGNPHWASASRYYLAKMYEDFYTDILAAEIPDDLNDEEAAFYFDELRNKIRPLMEQAMRFYEKTIILSERDGVDNDFTRRTQASLDRLKRYLNDNDLQARDEEMIRSGKVPSVLGEPPAAKHNPDARPKDIDDDNAGPGEDDPSAPSPDTLRRPVHQERHDITG